uniref:Uncharacterized protein n=1 Tax=Leptobrachium leishanense TaxID=445787 RepID=A0A8C5LVP8_9ANUR
MVRGKTRLSTPKPVAHQTLCASGPLDAFITPNRTANLSPPRAKMADGPPIPLPTTDSSDAICRLERLISALPTKADLADLVADLREGFAGDIREVRTEVGAIASRVSRLEEEVSHPPAHLAPPAAFGELQRRVDDLDNRGRRHNIRIRGLLEVDGPEDLRTILTEAFSMVLGQTTATPILMDRVHRALRPKPPPTAPPRDVVCCMTDFMVKERIMAAARTSRTWPFQGGTLEFFQDLSPFTLAARRCLQPVTQALRQADIPYRWSFPFALTAQRNGVRHTICHPSDVPSFAADMDLPALSVRNWETEDHRAAPMAPMRARRQRSRGRLRRSRDRAPVHLDPQVED